MKTVGAKLIPNPAVSRRQVLAGALAASAALTLSRSFSFSAPSVFAEGMAAKTTTAPWFKFNLNLMSNEQMMSIPGSGDKMSFEFDEYRPYMSILQFRQELGKYVDDATVANFERYLFVPVDYTQADAETIAQLPGVSSDIAAELASAGPYASEADFVAAVGGFVTADQVALLPDYLASATSDTANWTMSDLNSVTSDEIKAVPGTGDRMVKEFQEYRPYSSIVQFRNEIGKYVDDQTVSGFERYLFVPVDPMSADAATIAQIPGVSSDFAAELAKSVPFASVDDFQTAIAAGVADVFAALVPSYLVAS